MATRLRWRLTIALFLLPLLATRALAFDTWWHASCTQKAMTENGFSSDARLATQFSNYLTDYFSVVNDHLHIKAVEAAFAALGGRVEAADTSFDHLHFDAVFSTKDLGQNWDRLTANTKRLLVRYSTDIDKPGFREIVLFNILGASLHTVQDFYSHSNWVEQHSKAGISPIPLWQDVPAEKRNALDLYTGAYPAGSAPGHADHDTLNKDNSSRPLNAEAVEVACRASIAWVRSMMESAPEVPWQSLKGYNIQSDLKMKNFLVVEDSSFLTSSSILPGHFDGDKPAKFVFDKRHNPTIERAMAGHALQFTIGLYLRNLAEPKNTDKLPSPYWAGFRIYKISHDLADGLLKNGVAYVKP